MCEAIAIAVPNIRGAYTLIPGLIFFNFAFSGIFVKSPTLPNGAEWLPQISLFRWIVQSQVINLFSDDTTLPCIDQFYFCVYDGFMGLFGWTDISKWSCYWIIIANLAVFRGATLLALVFRSFSQKGRRQFRKDAMEEEKLY